MIERSRPRAIVDGRWIVAQGGVVHREVDRVEPEAVASPVEPEARDVEQGVLPRRIVDIEIGLAAEKIVQIILPEAGVEAPRGAAENPFPADFGSTPWRGRGLQ